MKTDYSKLTESDFSNTVHSYMVFLFSRKLIENPSSDSYHDKKLCLDTSDWKWFKYEEIFEINNGYHNKNL